MIVERGEKMGIRVDGEIEIRVTDRAGEVCKIEHGPGRKIVALDPTPGWLQITFEHPDGNLEVEVLPSYRVYSVSVGVIKVPA